MKKMKTKKLVFLILITFVLVIINSHLFAINFANKTVSFNPLNVKKQNLKDDEWEWFYVNGGWFELSKYMFIKDDDHNWNIKTGANQEFFRIGNDISFVFSADLEVVADKYDEYLNMNPRSIFWELEAQLYLEYSFGILNFGYHHRCKHDINVDEDYGRVLIYDSFGVDYSTNAFNIWTSDDFSGFFQILVSNDYFLVLDGDGVLNILDTFSIGLYVEPFVYKDDWAIYYNMAIQGNAYGEGENFNDRNNIEKIKIDYLAEIGWLGKGTNGKVYIFALYQYLSDTGIKKEVTSGELLSFGIRFTPSY